MALIATITIVAAVAFVAMEAVAWAAHKYLMHGPLWFIHKSHHRARRGRLELNDLYGVAFGAISVALMLEGPSAMPVAFAIGAGMAAYGLVYFLIHDVLVHRRIRHAFVPRSGFLHRIAVAHQFHHAVRERDGAVAFGFILPPDAGQLREQLKRNRRQGYRGTANVRTSDWVPSE